MDIDLVFKIAAIGIIVSILNQVLSRSGREEQATMTTIAGLVVVLMMIAQKIAQKGCLCDLHARQLTVGMRLLHRALKENDDRPLFARLLLQLDEFKDDLKQELKGDACCGH